MPDPDLVVQAGTAISAAVAAYGATVLTKAEDAAAAGTVRLGQRVLTRILRRGPAPELEKAVRDLAEAEPDEVDDAQAALRLELRRALKQDPQLRTDLAALLSTGVQASGERSIAIGGNNSGIVSTGDGAINIQHR